MTRFAGLSVGTAFALSPSGMVSKILRNVVSVVCLRRRGRRGRMLESCGQIGMDLRDATSQFVLVYPGSSRLKVQIYSYT